MYRNAVDHTFRFREIAAAVAKLRPDTAVLDAEVVVFDEQLVSGSSCSRRRLARDREASIRRCRRFASKGTSAGSDER